MCNMTVPEVMRELEKIEMIKGDDGVYRLGHLTATQKEILRVFGGEEFIKAHSAML